MSHRRRQAFHFLDFNFSSMFCFCEEGIHWFDFFFFFWNLLWYFSFLSCVEWSISVFSYVLIWCFNWVLFAFSLVCLAKLFGVCSRSSRGVWVLQATQNLCGQCTWPTTPPWDCSASCAAAHPRLGGVEPLVLQTMWCMRIEFLLKPFLSVFSWVSSPSIFHPLLLSSLAIFWNMKGWFGQFFGLVVVLKDQSFFCWR